ncbi:HAD-IA family hydrolase [Aestuariibius insulae]|uniref:HAD-IA family hydrolase n=1 Tax=Aestuariibius insulae TaxID=2058287 RepID=UPI00345EF70B
MGLFPKVDLKVVAWDIHGVLCPIEGTLDFDEALLDWAETLSSQGLRQIALTNAPPDRMREIQTHLGDWPAIDLVLTSAGTDLTKADPAFYDHVASELGTLPGSILLIDDKGANINAAAAAGWRGFRYSSLARDALKRSLKL